VLEGHAGATKVEIFGEFSRIPWEEKVSCQRCLNHWEAFAWIRVGQKFKFCLDDGKSFTVSSMYRQCDDGIGNLNNVYRFHNRTLNDDAKVRRAYKIIKIPKLKPKISDVGVAIRDKLKSFEVDEETQFSDYSTQASLKCGPQRPPRQLEKKE
jgi:hypothetical protein